MRAKDGLSTLLLTPLGRRRVAWGALYRLWPILGPVSALWRRTALRRTRFVAVVGSFGKTTATRAAMAVLGLPFERHTLWNAGGFVAAEMLRTRPGMPFGVLEVGIAHPGQMEDFARRIGPDIVVVTSIGSEHLRSFGTIARTRHEKAQMVRALPPTGLAILNGDDENVRWMATQTRARVVTYGFDRSNDVRAEEARLDSEGSTHFRVHVAGRRFDASIHLVGKHMVYPVLAAIALAREAGATIEDALFRLRNLSAAPERLEPLRTPSGSLILLDSKKGAIETIDTGLDVLRSIPDRRRLAVLGDIEEPPSSQGPLYKKLGEDLASIVDELVFVGGHKAYRSVAAGARSGGLSSERVIFAGGGVCEATSILRERLRPEDVVWIKGRSTQHLGRIGLALAGRHVSCDVAFCPPTPTCGSCPQLGRPERRSA